MSLSGLDSSQVDAAAKAISTERGGWFLLHYTSRDTVELLSQGTKGINELREAAEGYYDDTEADTARGPLFGMIDFRRRKVLIKLVKEGTSRLVNARVQVHWASVTARFPGHDSVFEPTSTNQLSENGVLAHIELHSGRSSAGSNKKAVLDGISEEGAEEAPLPLTQTSSKNEAVDAFTMNSAEHDVSPLSSVGGNGPRIDHPKRISSLISAAAATSAALQQSLANPPEQLAPVPEVSVTGVSPTFDPPSDWGQAERKSTDARSLLDMSDRRLSTASGRPSTANEYSSSLYDYDTLYKPKVKLGPRPSTTTSRPSSKASTAALPSGLRSGRPPSLRPKSRDSTYSAYRVPPPPPIPESSPLDFMPRPRSSGNSVKSLPATLPKSPGMTREKQRLMKFREMYKDKENKRAKEKSAKDIIVPSQDSESAPANNEDLQADIGALELVGLKATISNPAEELSHQRLSAISEMSDLRSAQASKVISPDLSKDATYTFKEVVDASKVSEGRRPSDESSPTFPVSSPVSLMDSSELTNSTRATSVSDDSSEHEKSANGDADNHAIGPKTVLPAKTVEEDEESESSTPTAASVADNLQPQPHTAEQNKRHTMVSPIMIPSNVDDVENPASETCSEHSFDDDLMDELQDAQVHQATSVSVSKSPITPFFSRRPSGLRTPSSTSSIIFGDATPLPSPMPPYVGSSPSPPSQPVEHAVLASLHNDATSTPAEGRNCASKLSENSGSSGTYNLHSEATQPVLESKSEQRPKLEEESNQDQMELLDLNKKPDADHKVQPMRDSGSKVDTGEDVKGERITLQPDTEQDLVPDDLKQKQDAEHNTIAATTPFIQLPPGLQKEPLVSPTNPHVPQPLGLGLSSIALQPPAAEERSQSKLQRFSKAATKSFHSRNTSPSNSAKSLSRSPSSTLLDAPQEDAVSIHMGRNLGSGVASKIAALQRNLSRGTAPPTPPVRPTSRKASLVSMRASSITDPMPSRDNTPPRSASSQFREEPHFRGRAMSKGSIRSFESRDGRANTPPRNLTTSNVGKLDSRRFSTFNNPAIEVTSKSETIQVKATIVRTDGQSVDSSPENSIHAGRSPSIATPSIAIPRTSTIVEEPRSPTRASMEKKSMHKRAQSSISSALGLIGLRSQSPTPTSEFPASPDLSDNGGRRSSRNSLDMSGSWRTLRRRASASISRSPSVSRNEIPRTLSAQSHHNNSPLMMSPTSNGSLGGHPGFSRSISSSSLESAAATDAEGDRHKRKGSRASKMLKRMSNSMTSMLQLGTLNEGTPRGLVAPVEEEKFVGADLGECNVQFPDNLLWKRRQIEIDTQGFLICKPHDDNRGQRTATMRSTSGHQLERRFHLSQFVSPKVPEIDRQEMPFSVWLDFRDERSYLQIAADSVAGQNSVLKALSEAHRMCGY